MRLCGEISRQDDCIGFCVKEAQQFRLPGSIVHITGCEAWDEHNLVDKVRPVSLKFNQSAMLLYNDVAAPQGTTLLVYAHGFPFPNAIFQMANQQIHGGFLPCREDQDMYTLPQ